VGDTGRREFCTWAPGHGEFCTWAQVFPHPPALGMWLRQPEFKRRLCFKTMWGPLGAWKGRLPAAGRIPGDLATHPSGHVPGCERVPRHVSQILDTSPGYGRLWTRPQLPEVAGSVTRGLCMLRPSAAHLCRPLPDTRLRPPPAAPRSTSVDSTASEMHGFSLSSGSFKNVSADWRLSEPLPFAVAQPVGFPFGTDPLRTEEAARASPSMGLDGSDSPPPEAAAQGGLPTSSSLRPSLLRGESAELERQSNGISGFTSRFQRRAATLHNVRVMASVVHQLSKGARPMESPASPRGSSGALPPCTTSG